MRESARPDHRAADERPTSPAATSRYTPKRWTVAKRQLAVLILVVVAMNGGAVFANHRMVNATRDLAAELPQDTDAELVLSMAR